MRYEHDCNTCVPLGVFGRYDLYVCSHDYPVIDTVIARFSSDGPDYHSGLEFAIHYREGGFQNSAGIEALSEALTRAERVGYVNP